MLEVAQTAPKESAQAKTQRPVRSASTWDAEAPVIPRKTCPCGGGCPRCQARLQFKGGLSHPGDPAEQEADSVAESVVRTLPAPAIQRKCAACEEEEQEETIQRKADPAADAHPAARALIVDDAEARLPAGAMRWRMNWRTSCSRMAAPPGHRPIPPPTTLMKRMPRTPRREPCCDSSGPG